VLIRSMLPTRFVWLCALTCLWFGSASALPRFALFESDQVRPLALSPSGHYLYAVNTPDNRLEVFEVTRDGLEHIDSVPVGLEPVAVAARDEGQVWVTNLLSDSVSVVDVRNPRQGLVERTLLVGDEPRDIVFAGQGRKRAFVTTAHRGQNDPIDPQLATPGVGRADVWVFDADNLGNKLGGSPLTIITLFTDTPRALAVSPDGSRVYAAGFHTGNRTTVASPLVNPPFTLPPPTTNFAGEPQPLTSLIVKFDGQHWVDELNRQFDPLVLFNLPDKDVFVIDANGRPPMQLAGSAGYFTSVGTILYNMTVNPVSGKVYVSNTEALNQNRFEGPGTFAGHSVRGNLHRSRITILGPGGGVTPRHLNKHIDYSTCCAPLPNSENARSLAFPTGMEVSPDGRTLYVAALGSSKVGIYDTAALEHDTFVPNEGDQIQVSGGGPTGLVLDSRRGRLYVLTRFDDGIAIVDVKRKSEVGKVRMHNPEPAKIVRGRRFMYDARLSSHGDSACASCHVFGDKDDLAWDLGNPDILNAQNNNPIGLSVINVFPLPPDPTFVAMKGPMTTQSLRGMANAGPMHWRGDRTGSRTQPNAQPDSGAFDEQEGFRLFNAAFTDLVGTPGPLPDQDMQAFTDFVLEMMYPPNPIRNLDNSLTPQQQLGRDIFVNRPTESVMEGRTSCEGCHTLDPNGNAQPGVEFPGFFGTQGKSSLESDQGFKVAHLRNLYTKVGKFGMPGFPPIIEDVPGAMGFQGDQIRGFGLSHAGDFDTVVRFTSATGFSQNTVFGPNPDGFPVGEAGLPLRHAVEAFLFAFDTNLKPIVGQQATLTDWNSGAVNSRVDLLIARADAGDCDLVAKGRFDGHRRGFLYVGGGRFKPDRRFEPLISDGALRAEISHPGEALTYTCVPPGSGYRIGIDRDNNGILDGDKKQE